MKNPHIRKRILAFLFPPKNDIKIISIEIAKLNKEMMSIYMMENKVQAIVRLVKYLSPIQEKNGFANLILRLQKKNYGQLDTTISALSFLQTYFSFYGSCVRSFSRAKHGEKVTADDVYFGGLKGYENLPASYWLANQKNLENEKYGSMPAWFFINDYLACSSVRSQTQGILGAINELQKAILQSKQN